MSPENPNSYCPSDKTYIVPIIEGFQFWQTDETDNRFGIILLLWRIKRAFFFSVATFSYRCTDILLLPIHIPNLDWL